MTDDGPVDYLDGHCSTNGTPDQFHALCPGHIRTQFGVELRCTCARHLNDKEESAD